MAESSTTRRRHLRCQLRQVSSVRVVGFNTAVEDLGTHTMHGMQVPYSRQMVWSVLTGKKKSDRMMMIIAKKRPDLFGIHNVDESVRKRGMELARLYGYEEIFL